jgi:hypothetical protein
MFRAVPKFCVSKFGAQAVLVVVVLVKFPAPDVPAVAVVAVGK